ncbi:heterokaryon incompatibility protein-domain-containing protein [Hyaloscypha finlandica]|nr:heterokaryon incompatibility protein-domain-containing protein [Hyaloscypha finlandica]
MMLLDFKYELLPSNRHIRLIRILPDGSLLPGVRISIEQVSLDEKPAFHAISYTWDYQVPKKHILCNGRRLKITEKCKEMLQDLLPNKDFPRLWIDAICIDQTSITEKNVQVPLMADIYKSATSTVVWLGQTDTWINRALGHLSAFNPCDHHWNRDVIRDRLTKLQENSETYRKQGQSRFPRETLRSQTNVFESVFGLSWFRRTWTLQEGSLAPLVWIRFAPEKRKSSDNGLMVSFDDILKHVDWLLNHAHEYLDSSTAYDSAGFQLTFEMIRPFAYFRRAVQSKTQSSRDLLAGAGMQPTMLDCFTKVNSESKDPKDRVYGLYGLFRALNLHKHLAAVEYSKPIENIYIDTVKAIITTDNSLDILNMINGHVQSKSLPSWVPDFTCLHKKNETSEKFLQIEPTLFRATFDSPRIFSFSESNILHTQGHVIDHIERVPAKSAPSGRNWFWTSAGRTPEGLLRNYPLLSSYSQDWYQTFREWATLVLSLESEAPIKTSVQAITAQQAYFRCLTLGVWSSSSEPPLPTSVLNSYLKDEFPMWWLVFSMAASGDIPWHEYANLVRQKFKDDEESLVEFEAQFQTTLDHALMDRAATAWAVISIIADSFNKFISYRSTVGRNIFVTRHGYLGIGIDQMKKEDSILLISGLSVPMVARIVAGDENQYRLIGSAYIPGVMEGECWCGDKKELTEFAIV